MNGPKTKRYKVIVEVEVEVDAPTDATANSLARERVDKMSIFTTVGSKIKKLKRTAAQNNALHKYFQMVADHLLDVGADYQEVVRVDVPWNQHMVKELLWRPTQKAIIGKDSTTNLTTNEIDKVFTPIHKALNERAGIDVPFPSIRNI